jgi:hypothetical protein
MEKSHKAAVAVCFPAERIFTFQEGNTGRNLHTVNAIIKLELGKKKSPLPPGFVSANTTDKNLRQAEKIISAR